MLKLEQSFGIFMLIRNLFQADIYKFNIFYLRRSINETLDEAKKYIGVKSGYKK